MKDKIKINQGGKFSYFMPTINIMGSGAVLEVRKYAKILEGRKALEAILRLSKYLGIPSGLKKRYIPNINRKYYE